MSNPKEPTTCCGTELESTIPTSTCIHCGKVYSTHPTTDALKRRIESIRNAKLIKALSKK